MASADWHPVARRSTRSGRPAPSRASLPRCLRARLIRRRRGSPSSRASRCSRARISRRMARLKLVWSWAIGAMYQESSRRSPACRRRPHPRRSDGWSEGGARSPPPRGPRAAPAPRPRGRGCRASRGGTRGRRRRRGCARPRPPARRRSPRRRARQRRAPRRWARAVSHPRRASLPQAGSVWSLILPGPWGGGELVLPAHRLLGGHDRPRLRPARSPPAGTVGR